MSSPPSSLRIQGFTAIRGLAALGGNGSRSEDPRSFTFDDVLLKPGLSDILPSDADIRYRATRARPLNIPIIASAVDTVT